MKTRRPTSAMSRRPAICTSRIATAVLVLSQVAQFSPSASADTFSTPFGTQQVGDPVTGPNLFMNGGGLLLLNSANGYTGTTAISDGSVSIRNGGALGADASTILIGALPVGTAVIDATRGGGAGNLTLGGGITLSRDILARGFGSTGDSGAIVNVGDNTISGTVSTGTGSGTRVYSSSGTLTLGGPVNLAFAQTTDFRGNSNIVITGNIAGGSSAALSKNNGGSLTLSGTNTYGGVTTVAGGFLRVSSGANLGANAGVTLQGATLEIRGDAPAIGKTLTNNTGTGVLFVDHAAGSSLQGGAATFTSLVQDANRTTTLNGRNGFGVTFGAGGTSAAVTVNQAGNANITNNMNGLVTYNGNFWNRGADGTSRNFTLAGNGDTLITGNILAAATGTAQHSISKSGTGTLTIQGVASTYNGDTNITGGTVAINAFGALGAGTTGSINISNNGALSIIGNNVGSLTTDKQINLAGNGSILANQLGTSPAIIINNFVVTGTASRTFTLGGANALDNELVGPITNGTGTAAGIVSVAKTGNSTWVLSGTNTYTGNTTINDGTLKVKANAAASTIIPDVSNLVFNNDGGVFEFVGQAGAANVENLGQLVTQAGAATLRLTPGAGGTTALGFTGVGTASTTIASLNIQAAAGNTVTVAGLADGFVGSNVYYNGADFAIATGGTGLLAAPVYGTTAGFVTSASALTAGSHNEITGSFTDAAGIAINSLKINGAQTLTLTGALTVNSGGAANSGGILQTGGAGVIAQGVGGSILTGGTTGNLIVRVDGASSLDIQVPLVTTGTAGASGLVKNGPGTLVLSAANTQRGTTVINEGLIQLGAGTVSTLSAANQGLTIRDGASLDVNGRSITVGAFNNSGTVTNSNAGAVTITVGGGNGTGTSIGTINETSGVINLTKAGTGGQTWNNVSNYTGVTTITSTGIVSVTTLANGGVNSSIGASTNAATNLVFNGTASATGATAGLSYTGTDSVSTDRLFTIAGAANNTGARIQANGANNASLVFSNAGPIAITGTGTKILTLGGASLGDNTFNPQIVDGAGTAVVSVRKEDAGLWILGNAANTYTGSTTINNGTLQAQDGTSLPTNSLLQIGIATGSTATTSIFQSSGNFVRALGAGAGQVTVGSTGSAGNAGFAASVAKLNVNLAGTATWGSADFLAGGQQLLLGSSTSLAEVDFQSGIDLNGGTRIVNVLDNTNTGSDRAVISGVISGTGAASVLAKIGGNLNITGNANTYEGNTEVRAGTLSVTSLGQNAGVGTSSVGAWGANQVLVGVSTTAAVLDYIGAGETSSRAVIGNGTGAGVTIRANGSGALSLSNVSLVTTTGTATRTITLGGENTGPNDITNVITDYGAPTAIAKADGGVWLLSQQHTFTGGVTNNGGGGFGIAVDATGTSGPFGTGTLTLGNGVLYAVGADRTIINNVTIANNTTTGFAGDNSITIDAPVVVAGGNNQNNYNNYIAAGESLTINGQFSHGDTNTKLQNFAGSGETIINGLITQTGTSGALSVQMSGVGGTEGRLLINNSGNNFAGNLNVSGGTLVINAAQGYLGSTTVSGGVLELNAVGAISTAGGTASILNLNGGTTRATSDANGVITNNTVLGGNPTISGPSTIAISGSVTNSGGNRTVTNDIVSGKELLISGQVNLSNDNTARTLTMTGSGQTTISGLITNGGTAAGVFTKAGSGTTFLTNPANTYSGATNINGGILNVAALANGGAPSSIGQAAVTANLLTINNGTLQFTGASAQSTNKLFQIGAGNATIDASGGAGGSMSFTSTGNVVITGTSATPRSLILTGSNTDLNTLRPNITAVGSIGVLNVVKNGTGTWQLTGTAANYTGGTTINAGTLLVNNAAGTATGSGLVTVNTNGTLGGSGTLTSGIVTNGGTVAPGNSIGNLTGTSADFSGGGTLSIEINTDTLTSDKLTLSAGLTLAGLSSVLSVTDLGSTTVTLGQTFNIASYGSLSGLFSVGGNVIADFDPLNPTLNAFAVGSNFFGIDYDAPGNNINLVATVPEPGTVCSLLAGASLLLGVRRRRSSRKA